MKNDISVLNKSQLTMSSREIAELTNKEHKNVLRVIRELISAQLLDAQIEPLKFEYRNQWLDYYELNKRDSLVIVARLSPEFMAFVVDRWQELEEQVNKNLLDYKKGELKNIQQPSKSYLPEYRKAKAMELSVRALDKVFSNLPHLSEQSKQAIYADTINPIAGKNVIPLPRLDNKTFSASEVGEMLGVSSNKIGRITNELNLKTEEYGIFVLDKSRSSDKQVESFRYNEKAIDVIRNHLINKETA